MNSRKCEICKVDVHRACYVEHKLDDKQLNKELAKKMLNPYYFTERK